MAVIPLLWFLLASPAFAWPLWSDEQALLFMETLRHADEEGLDPEDYGLETIETQWKGPDRDHLLTKAFLHYAKDISEGRLDPHSLAPECAIRPPQRDFSPLLEEALAKGRLKALLDSLPPPYRDYALLREALARYRAIETQGGWPTLPGGPSLKPGMEDPRVAILRKRLAITGDIQSQEGGPLFDPALEEAVKRFQHRHGLEIDGVVGKKTRAALNVPVEMRIRQIILNMERWRWLPRELGERYALVNMAGFWLKVREKDEEALSMAVIVGRPYRRTPVFASRITHIVYNPTWTVPKRIAVQDILPKVKKDPAYLKREHIRVFSGWDKDAEELDPEAIDWRAIDVRHFPYVFRQDPGPWNALGRIKFILPNPFDVYLHDTPHRELFKRRVRTFSSGCIRLEKPLALASYLLKAPQETIEAAIEEGATRTVRLPSPLPIYLLYLTAWVEEGLIHFRQDVYGRDRRLARALGLAG